jgi:hypothetical protein
VDQPAYTAVAFRVLLEPGSPKLYQRSTDPAEVTKKISSSNSMSVSGFSGHGWALSNFAGAFGVFPFAARYARNVGGWSIKEHADGADTSCTGAEVCTAASGLATLTAHSGGGTCILFKENVDTMGEHCPIKHLQPGPGEYVTTQPVETSPDVYTVTGIAKCALPPNNGTSYVTAACVPGKAGVGPIGVNGTDTVIAGTCSHQRQPADGTWVSATCDPGNYDRVGADTATMPCSKPSSGSIAVLDYTNNKCVAGSANAMGSDLKLGTKCGPSSCSLVWAPPAGGSRPQVI